jgi:hypothetical protein
MLDEYRKHIEKDSALQCRFHPVQVDGPSVQYARLILQRMKKCDEEYPSAKYTDKGSKKLYNFLPDIFLINPFPIKPLTLSTKQQLKQDSMFLLLLQIRK